MTLRRLIYRSVPCILGTAEEVAAEIARILEASKRNNAAAGVTGVLLFSGAAFTQVLEGEAAALERVYDRISQDLRHQQFELLQVTEIDRRAFGAWSMGYVDAAGLGALWRDDPVDPSADPGGVDALVRRILALAPPDRAAA